MRSKPKRLGGPEEPQHGDVPRRGAAGGHGGDDVDVRQARQDEHEVEPVAEGPAKSRFCLPERAI